MSRQNKMIKTTIIYFIGNFASKLLAFFLLPLYTAYLTPDDFGKVDIIISTLPLIAPIFTMQVTESIFRFLCSDNNNEEKKITITNSAIIFLFGIITFIILYIPFISKFNIEYSVLFFIYFVITYIGIFLQQVLRGLQRNIEYAVTGIIATVVQATLNIILITKFGLGGESLLIASIGASSIITIIVALRVKIWSFIDIKLISIDKIRKQLKYGIPLIPNQICWWIIGLLGKYILLYFSGSSDNGLLAVASKFPSLLTTISSIFFLAWTENIIREFNSSDRDEYFSKAFNLFFIFSISSAACLLPIIKLYNMKTISGDFSIAWVYVPILYIGALFNGFSSFLGTVYTASMKTKAAFTTTVVAAISNLIFSLTLTPFIGIWGVVLSNMLSFIVLFFARIKSTKKIVKVNINIRDFIKSIVLLVVSIIIYYCVGVTGQMVFLLISIFITILFNKDIILTILNPLISKYIK